MHHSDGVDIFRAREALVAGGRAVDAVVPRVAGAVRLLPRARRAVREEAADRRHLAAGAEAPG